MAHVKKYTRTSLGHMLKHYERAKMNENEYIRFGNENIDTSKTHENYNLGPERDISQLDFINQRISEVDCLKRKDVNLMCTWVVTLPKGFPQEKEKEFFQQTYNFLEDRYGKENVISAYVHKDEITPHIHFSFVPVAYDVKKEKFKVSAKLKVCKTDLTTFHKDLDKKLSDHFGRDVGILNEKTKEGNKSIEELKRGTAIEKLKKANVEHDKVIKSLAEHKKELNIVRADIKTIKNYKVKISYLQDMKVKKSLVGGNVTLNQKDFDLIMNLAKNKVIMENNYEKMEKEVNDLRKEVKKYKPDLKDRLKDTKKIVNSKNNIKGMEKELKNMEKFIKKNNLMPQYNAFVKLLSKSMGLER